MRLHLLHARREPGHWLIEAHGSVLLFQQPTYVGDHSLVQVDVAPLRDKPLGSVRDAPQPAREACVFQAWPGKSCYELLLLGLVVLLLPPLLLLPSLVLVLVLVVLLLVLLLLVPAGAAAGARYWLRGCCCCC